MNAIRHPFRAEPALPRDSIASAIAPVARHLRLHDYSFAAVTPETHRRVIANNAECKDVLRDVFGWNRSFARDDIAPPVFDALESAAALQRVDHSHSLWRSRIRFATLGKEIFAHSAFPTDASDSVFFGPDTYRFAALIQRAIAARSKPVDRIVDIGCGSGAGAIVAAKAAKGDTHIVLADINPVALDFAAANAESSGIDWFECVESDVFSSIAGAFDLVVSNPPYLCDPKERLYRHGGNAHGAELSLRILRESLPRLRPNGQLVLYTGTAIVDGVDTFFRGAIPHLKSKQLRHDYVEIDPDVFGEELDRRQYAHVERIAAVGLVVTRIE
ncbi:MAG: methyltransferase [Rudaea sp.]